MRPTIALASDGEELLAYLEKANLLSRCGEPLPKDTTVARIASLQQALQTISGSLLDAVPRSNWDKAFTRAFRECRRTLRRQHGIWERLLLQKSIRERSEKIEDLTERRVRQSAFARKLTASDSAIVVLHLTEMLNVVSLILDAKRTVEWPLLVRAADSALNGYLPVDLEGTVEPCRVLVY